MTETTDATDALAETWAAALGMFVASQPGGVRREERGTTMMVSHAPIPLLNGIFVLKRSSDPSSVEEFAASPVLASVPWSIQTRVEPDEQTLRVAAAHGLKQRTPLPFMAKELNDHDALPEDNHALEIRKVSEDMSADYQEAMAAGFEAPEELFSVFTVPALLSHSQMWAYLVSIRGVTVATSFGVYINGAVGVFNISVPPQHRRSGFGRAATAAVLREARSAGAHTAYLHATPLGVPLYRSMGFHVAETWTVLTA